MAASEPGVKDDAALLPERPGYRWELLTFCWLAYFLNRADRAIYAAVLEPLRADLGLSSAQAGLVSTAFSYTYGIMVPLAGYLGDRGSRKWIWVMSLLVWSAATVFTGDVSRIVPVLSATMLSVSAAGVVSLVVIRGLATGGGEAFYYPAANSLLSQFHQKTRALAMSIHQTSFYVGVVFGSWLAGWIADNYGWQYAFYWFGSLGVLLALVTAWRIDNTPQPVAAAIAGDKSYLLRDALRWFAHSPTLILLTLAFGGMVFVDFAFLNWMPTFLQEEFEQSKAAAGFNSMFYHFLFAFLGALAGGWLADRGVGRWVALRMDIEYLALWCGAPFIYVMSQADVPETCYIGLAGFGLFRGFYDSNLFAAPFDVIPTRLRSTTTGMILCAAFMVGAISPWLLGALKGPLGLRGGMALLAIVFAASGVLILVARLFFFHRDRERKLLEDLHS